MTHLVTNRQLKAAKNGFIFVLQNLEKMSLIKSLGSLRLQTRLKIYSRTMNICSRSGKPMKSFLIILFNSRMSSQEIFDKVAAQGDIVRQLKTEKASKEDITAAVEILKKLKLEYKDVAGSDYKPGKSILNN